MDLGLANRRVLVTGASRGIGLAIARGFLSEGCRVAIVSRGSDALFDSEKALIDEFGDNIVALGCDCSDQDALSALVKQVKQKWDGLDVVVANVGDGRSVPDPLPKDQQWQNTWRVNFDSALLTARAFLPMLTDSKGSLLFISSITGLEAFGAPVDYSTAKAALIALSKNMARKLAQDVRVNVIAPGNVYFSGSSWDEKLERNREQIEAVIESTVPMKRFGTPEEIANAAVFICSERASFITGSVLVVDGGQTVGVS